MHLSSQPGLAGLRIGCVQYLNARPLIHACNVAVEYRHPSELAARLVAGELDAALVPVFELFRHPEFLVADGVAIASYGPVYSVFLAHRGPLGAVRKVILDPASLTSSNLVRIILGEFHGLHPEYAAEGEGGAFARLLIGNQAIRFREEHGDEWHYLDLGAEWTRSTALPFVYAAWLMRPELPSLREAAGEFRRMKEWGCAHIEEIAAAQTWPSPAFCRRYLTESIRFDLGQAEKDGLQRFRDLSVKNGLIPASAAPIRYI